MPHLGTSPTNLWTVSDRTVDLVRPVIPPRRLTISARPQDVILDLNRTALLILDMQNDFCDPEGWFASKGVDIRPIQAVIPVLNRLLPVLRSLHIPILWINWGNRPDRLNLSPSLLHAGNPNGAGLGYGDRAPSGRGEILRQDSWGSEITAALQVEPSDIQVYKYRFSGFWDNELDSILRNLGITTLLYGGINLDRCLFATLQDGSFLGYDSLLIQDAAATVSPQYVSDAIVFLIHQIYGFTTQSEAFLEALHP
ncbi:MAG: cysteine hydrolase family protein [Oculatellaceae cyanobacterium Prado106]|jgi:nicotinamidase-related amidase|nr:cysteine hydrolase family protein [Oculatellaceae cyanobacterium Prado106]